MLEAGFLDQTSKMYIFIHRYTEDGSSLNSEVFVNCIEVHWTENYKKNKKNKPNQIHSASRPISRACQEEYSSTFLN